MSRPPLDEFSKRDMNQFNKHYSISSDVSKKAPRSFNFVGALFGFAIISAIYSVTLLGVTSILRDAGVISWSLSLSQAVRLSALVVLVRTVDRATSAVVGK